MCEIGQISPEAGRYRCAICGAEIRMKAGESFPSCPGEDHSPRWTLCDEDNSSLAGSARHANDLERLSQQA
jgi:hypothetical protein